MEVIIYWIRVSLIITMALFDIAVFIISISGLIACIRHKYIIGIIISTILFILGTDIFRMLIGDL